MTTLLERLRASASGGIDFRNSNTPHPEFIRYCLYLGMTGDAWRGLEPAAFAEHGKREVVFQQIGPHLAYWLVVFPVEYTEDTGDSEELGEVDSIEDAIQLAEHFLRGESMGEIQVPRRILLRVSHDPQDDLPAIYSRQRDLSLRLKS